jgi:hypothetical protein
MNFSGELSCLHEGFFSVKLNRKEKQSDVCVLNLIALKQNSQIKRNGAGKKMENESK